MWIRVKKHIVLTGVVTFLIIFWLFFRKNTTVPDISCNSKQYSQDLDSEVNYIGNVPLLKTRSSLNDIKQVTAKKCATRTNLLDLEISNSHYQVMRTKDGPNSTIIYAYGAYMDSRLEIPAIKILIISEKHWNVSNIGSQKPNYCQMWYPNNLEPTIVKVNNIEYAWNEKAGIDGKYHPYLLTYNLPRINDQVGPIYKNEVPESVSIVQSPCDKATNELSVNYKVPSIKKSIGVCVKGLDMPTKDMSVRMVQWIEMLKILGVDGIHFHLFDVHPKTLKVLDYYKETGFVTVKPFSLPGFQPDFPNMRHQYLYDRSHLTKKRRQEVIPYNDCFMTEMYSYKYIAILDMDEIILPLHHSKWTELLDELDAKRHGSRNYCFQMILFVDRIVNGSTVLATAPDLDAQVLGYPYMMNKLNYELKTVCNEAGHRAVKCLHDTEDVIIARNHFPTKCMKKSCYSVIPPSTAYVHHHKDSCQVDRHNETILPQPFGRDTSLLKYNHQLSQNSNKIILQLAL